MDFFPTHLVMLPVWIAFDTTRIDPSDVEVQKLIDSKNFKAADRFLARIENKKPSVRVKINRCLLQLADIHEGNAFQAWERMQAIVRTGKPPIVDINILEAIDKSLPQFIHVLKPDFLPTMWERAIGAQPKNVNLYETAWTSMIHRKDFVEARKIAMKAGQNLSNKRLYRWRAISACQLNARFGDDPVVCKVSIGMATALIKQSIAAVSSLETVTSKMNISSSAAEKDLERLDHTSVAVQTSNDVQTIVRVYKAHGKYEEALAVLEDSSTVGLRSSISGMDFQLVIEKCEILREMEKYDELWKFCHQLLCDAGDLKCEQEGSKPYNFSKASDDIIIWEFAALACRSMNTLEVIAQFQRLLQHPGFKERHRNLMSIEIGLAFQDSKLEIPNFTRLEDALEQYIKKFGTFEFAYTDLASYTSRMTDEQHGLMLSRFREMTEEMSQEETDEKVIRTYIHARLNFLKLTYNICLCIKEDSVTREEQLERLETFNHTCLDLYMRSLEIDKDYAVTERHTGDEAAILAACGFIRMREHGRTEGRLQAIMILEKLLETSKYHFNATVLLVRLYVAVGCFDKAINMYNRLDVKNVQVHTESWFLLTRLGSIFPYQKGKLNVVLHKLLKRYAKYIDDRDGMEYSMGEMYERDDNFYGLCEVYEFTNEAKQSIARSNILAEIARIEYRHGIGDCFEKSKSVLEHMESIEPLVKFNGDYAELRSLAAVPNYDAPGSKTTAELTNIGRVPMDGWVRSERDLHKWLRYTAHPFNVHLLDVNTHMQASIDFQRLGNEIKEVIIKGLTPKGLTKVETTCAWAICTMSALQEAERAARAAYDGLDTAKKADKDFWVNRHLTLYEMQFKVCIETLQTAVRILLKYSGVFKQAPNPKFSTSEWEVLHYYYKSMELLMIWPQFLASRMDMAKIFRGMMNGSSADADVYQSLDVESIQKELRQTMESADSMVNNYVAGAKLARELWKSNELAARIGASARGGYNVNKNKDLIAVLEDLFDEKWATKKCSDMIEGWRESMSGLEVETAKTWWMTRWSSIVPYM